jgi:hypothetical protein
LCRWEVTLREFKFLRNVCGMRLLDKQLNEQIEEDKHFLNKRIEDERYNFIDHIQRLGYVKQILKLEPNGRRDLGKPLKRWISEL